MRPACICAVLCGALTQRKAKEKKEEKRNGSNDGCAKLVPNLQRERIRIDDTYGLLRLTV